MEHGEILWKSKKICNIVIHILYVRNNDAKIITSENILITKISYEVNLELSLINENLMENAHYSSIKS